eukprot:3287086-Prymnesium_polylepis.1
MSGSKEKHADLEVIISTHAASTSCPAIIIVIPWTDIDSDYKNELTDDQLAQRPETPGQTDVKSAAAM